MDGGERQTAYSARDYRANYPGGVQYHYWNQSRNRLLYELVREHAGAGRVIDIGCGRGIVVDYLRQRDIDAWGCELGEPSPISARIAPYLELGSDAAEADCRHGARCALLLDVIEHLADPRSFATRIIDSMESLDRLILTVPARAEIWSEWDEAFGHYRRYSLEDLAGLIDDLGLVLIDAGYFFHALYLAARVIGALGVSRSTRMRAPSSRPARLAHRLIGAALSAERRLVPSSLPGSSLYAVAAVPSRR